MAQTGTKLSHIGVIKIKTNGEIISEMIDSVPEPVEKQGAPARYPAEKGRRI